MARTDARVRYTRKVLKESLLTLLQEKPVNRITVKEVCELAELNRATFYAHYSDCFALKEQIEDDLVAAFGQALEHVRFLDVSGLIGAIYDMIGNNELACRVLVFQGAGAAVLERMIALARDRSVAFWRTRLTGATEAELDLLYIHLSNGLMRVVIDGYDRYDREIITAFVSRIVRRTLSGFLSRSAS